jgi:hypothetical protein
MCIWISVKSVNGTWLLFAIPFFLFSSCEGACYSDTAQHKLTQQGEVAGVVNNLETSGFFWKTASATISLGFTKNGTGTVNTANERFCVLDNGIYNQLELAKDQGVPVKVSYDGFFTVPFWKCGEDNLIITGVKVLQ